MFKVSLALVGSLAGLTLAVSVAVANQGGASRTCNPRLGAPNSGCPDPVGDVQGSAAGPDIASVVQIEWGVIGFHVTFARGHPLIHSAAFTDKVSVLLTFGPTKRYELTVSAGASKREVLRRLPNGKPVTLVGTADNTGWVGKEVTLSFYPRQIGAGLPRQLDAGSFSYRVKAVRVLRNGTLHSSDYAPNKGTWRGP